MAASRDDEKIKVGGQGGFPTVDHVVPVLIVVQKQRWAN